MLSETLWVYKGRREEEEVIDEKAQLWDLFTGQGSREVGHPPYSLPFAPGTGIFHSEIQLCWEEGAAPKKGSCPPIWQANAHLLGALTL